MTDVQGRCPVCGGASLFLGGGGHVTCSRLDCPAPDTADALLHGGETVLIQSLGGDRKARVIAHTLHFHGHSLADVRRMTDEQLRAVPGIGETSLARIRAAIPAPEPGPDDVTLDALQLIFTRWKNAGHTPSPAELLELIKGVRAVAATEATEPEPSNPAECSGEAGPCPEHGHHEDSLKQPGEAAGSPLRDQIADVIREFPFDNFGLDDISYLLESTPDTQEWVPKLAAAVLAVLDPHGDTGAAIGRGHRCFLENHVARIHDAEEAVKRVRAARERMARGRDVDAIWCLGLLDAALDGKNQPTGCPCHNGDELCSGCRRCPNICHGCDGASQPDCCR